MKKVNLKGKLSLSKEIISKLDLKNIKGGAVSALCGWDLATKHGQRSCNICNGL
jgi:hypothetical protein